MRRDRVGRSDIEREALGGVRHVQRAVRSAAATPAGPETKSIASFAIAYRSARHASGDNGLDFSRPAAAESRASSIIWSIAAQSG